MFSPEKNPDAAPPGLASPRRSESHGLRRGLHDIVRFAGFQATRELILALMGYRPGSGAREARPVFLLHLLT